MIAAAAGVSFLFVYLPALLCFVCVGFVSFFLSTVCQLIIFILPCVSHRLPVDAPWLRGAVRSACRVLLYTPPPTSRGGCQLDATAEVTPPATTSSAAVLTVTTAPLREHHRHHATTPREAQWTSVPRTDKHGDCRQERHRRRPPPLLAWPPRFAACPAAAVAAACAAPGVGDWMRTAAVAAARAPRAARQARQRRW